MIPDVLVLGGGCAGLAAATALAECGASVRVLESRRAPGGRSRSWVDPATGDVEDNGQHLILGCYDEFLSFLRRTGALSELRFQERAEILLLEAGGRVCRFARGPLPPPLDLLWGLLGLRGFPLRDVLAARALLRDLRRPADGADRTVARWLGEMGQSGEARRRFWDPLVLATLNLAPSRAPRSLLVEVLRRALLGGAEASRIGFAGRGLGPLIVEPALRFLARHGGTVQTGAPVTGLEWDPAGRFSAARTRDGSLHRAGSAVLATPHREAALLLAGRADGFDERRAEALAASSIVAVHLWFDRAVSPHAMAGLIDSPIHWVFDRGRMGGARPPGYLALVTSGADEMVRWEGRRLQALALEELFRFFPLARGASLRRARVLKERRATPAFGPDQHRLRPGVRTSIPNLCLAGDWTATGLPATLEGAAASGHRAAAILGG